MNRNLFEVRAGQTVRSGKTQKDHASGAQRRNENNKAKRGSWSNIENSGRNDKNFPAETCAGKRHRPPSFKARRKGGNRKRN